VRARDRRRLAIGVALAYARRMHYKDGTPVELEDVLRYPATIADPDAEGGYRKVTREGIVILQLSSTGDRCNVQVASPIIIRPTGGTGPGVPMLVFQSVTVSTDECELVHRKA
jgi:hypothetical protein